MDDAIEIIDREVALNSGNINQLQIDFRHNDENVSNLITVTNQLIVQVYQLETELRNIKRHLNL